MSVSRVVPSWFFHVTVYVLVVALNCAVYVVAPVIAATAGDQPLNEYEYCAVDALVGVLPLYVGFVPYATPVSVSSTVPSWFFHVTVYFLVAALNCAVYVVAPVIAATAGDQPVNVYEYCAVDAFVGVLPLYVGVVP